MWRHMKIKQLLFVLGLLLFAQQAMAQDITVTGRVTAAGSGEALVGVSILVQGTSRGTNTDLDGNYSITVQQGENVLIFSYVGFITTRIEVNGRSRVDVVMAADVTQFEDVVVTAFGIERERRALGYSIQDVSSDDIARTGAGNMLNALQGQVAGVQISSGAGAGSGSQIFIRGISSLSPGADNQPLFVVDGVPIDNSTSESFGRVRGMSNRAIDINPNDIANVSVLKGAAATALYGVRAANGAVIITTKQGQAGDVRVDFSHSVSREDIINMPDYQDVYGQGFAFAYDPNSTVFGAWGPTHDQIRQINPDARYYNNWENAMQTGMGISNSIAISGGTQSARFFTSIANSRNEGVIPNNDWERTSIRLTGEVFKGPLTVAASANYINSGGNRVPFVNFMERLAYWSNNADVRDYKFEDGRHKSSVGNGLGSARNPLFDAYTNTYEDNVNRMIGNIRSSYQVNDWFSVDYRVGLDTYSDERTDIEPGPLGIAGEFAWSLGFIEETRINSRDITSNFAFNVERNLTEDIGMRLRVGNDVFERRRNWVRARGAEFVVPQFTHLSNARNISVSQNMSKQRLVGVYGDLNLDWKNVVYLNVTGRNDWSSTLPEDNRSFFYPSVNLSVVFSDLLELPTWMTYGKVRASYAEVGKDAPPYSLAVTYVAPALYPIGGQTGFTRSSQLGTIDLKPERTVSNELGLDMRFLDNRLALDLTFYKANSKDQIIGVPVSNATGFATFITNAGEIENRGFEVTLRATPFEGRDFRWNLVSNFTTNKNEVVSIRDGVDAIFLGDMAAYINRPFMQLVPGQSYGAIWGTSYARYYAPGESPKNPQVLEKDRPILIGANGFPVIDNTPKIVGDATPDWQWSLTNTFNYRQFDFSFMVDVLWGADRYNKLDQWDSAFGHTTKTLNRSEYKVFDGVLADGTPNTRRVFLGQGVGPEDGIDYGAGYHRNIYRVAVEQSVEDASYVKLRSVTLGYNMSHRALESLPFRSLRASVTANNLLLWTNWSQYDPETVISSGSNLFGLVDLAYPGTRSLVFSLNFSF